MRPVRCSVTGLVFWTAAMALAQTPDFATSVQPVLEKSCYNCHGPELQMGGLRLDSKALAAKSIVPGKSTDSTLYQRVAGLNGLARMPMGGKLPPEQIEAIKAWIDAGAEWPENVKTSRESAKKHWAFVPPQRPPVPASSTWARNDIDRFILARLEKERLKPSLEAGRITLLRRLSLDITGLPPTPDEVDAFVADKRPDAYEKQVDRLLASPHYGERWGRHWLDAARYADSDGYEKDKSRQVWFYRDWVINALNRDLGYDQFVIAQIAGDLLPNATQDQHVATGFLRNSMINEEGGIEPEQFRMEAMFDRMEAIGKGVLGVTIQCAQCHNHKYDPLRQEEYFKLFAFLNNSHEANVSVYTPAEQMKRADILRRTGEIEAELQHRTPDWDKRMASWERSVEPQTAWTVVQPEVDDISTGGQKYVPAKDGSLLAQGYAPTKHNAKLTLKTAVSGITGFRLELLTDPNLPLNGPGRSPTGTGALTEFRVEAGTEKSPEKIKIASAFADVNP
ncbi:MAG: DUF1549 domain-containing protein, partial [Bryobacteraceae bacterium]|nr:DUF1549 domain-containing protein [Bryobacteraceae bacterium]